MADQWRLIGWRAADSEGRRIENRGYYAAHSQELSQAAAERQRVKRQNDPEWAERQRAKCRERYRLDPGPHVERASRWAAANREKVRASVRRWQQTDHGRTRHGAAQADRRARKRGQFVERVDPLVVLERDDGMCGIPENFHVDHIVPLARGGLHNYENSQAAHPACNIAKGAR